MKINFTMLFYAENFDSLYLLHKEAVLKTRLN